MLYLKLSLILEWTSFLCIGWFFVSPGTPVSTKINFDNATFRLILWKNESLEATLCFCPCTIQEWSIHWISSVCWFDLYRCTALKKLWYPLITLNYSHSKSPFSFFIYIYTRGTFAQSWISQVWQKTIQGFLTFMTCTLSLKTKKRLWWDAPLIKLFGSW